MPFNLLVSLKPTLLFWAAHEKFAHLSHNSTWGSIGAKRQHGTEAYAEVALEDTKCFGKTAWESSNIDRIRTVFFKLPLMSWHETVLHDQEEQQPCILTASLGHKPASTRTQPTQLELSKATVLPWKTLTSPQLHHPALTLQTSHFFKSLVECPASQLFVWQPFCYSYCG